VKVKTLGIDLAKETFGLHGVDALGRVAVHRRVTRKQLLVFLVKLETPFAQGLGPYKEIPDYE